MEGTVSSSGLLLTRFERNEIDALSDEVLVKILETSESYDHHRLRAELPLVCKRWRDAIYSAQGEVQHVKQRLDVPQAERTK